jgi:hypothetical protein
MENNETLALSLLTDAESNGSFCVTLCVDHGTRSCDHASARHYVELVNSWRGVDHTDTETSPWWCCDRMVVDPRGAFDH